MRQIIVGIAIRNAKKLHWPADERVKKPDMPSLPTDDALMHSNTGDNIFKIKAECQHK